MSVLAQHVLSVLAGTQHQVLGGIHRINEYSSCCRDWMGKYQGSSRLALRPSSTDEVSQLLAYCSLRRLAVVPQAGNTGLVGGSVPVFDEIIFNMSSMNKIISFDEVSRPRQAEGRRPRQQQEPGRQQSKTYARTAGLAKGERESLN